MEDRKKLWRLFRPSLNPKPESLNPPSPKLAIGSSNPLPLVTQNIHILYIYPLYYTLNPKP